MAFCATSTAIRAQTATLIELSHVAVDKSMVWTGATLEASTQVKLRWYVADQKPIEKVVVERSFDQVHFYFAGNASLVNSPDGSSGIRFEDRIALLNKKPVAHYRIRYTNHQGQVFYSAAKPVSQ